MPRPRSHHTEQAESGNRRKKQPSGTVELEFNAEIRGPSPDGDGNAPGLAQRYARRKQREKHERCMHDKRRRAGRQRERVFEEVQKRNTQKREGYEKHGCLTDEQTHRRHSFSAVTETLPVARYIRTINASMSAVRLAPITMAVRARACGSAIT